MNLYQEFLNQAVKSIIQSIQNDKLIPIMQRQQTSQAFIFERVKEIVDLIYSEQRQLFIKKLLQIIQSQKLQIKNYEVQLGQDINIWEPSESAESVFQVKKQQRENNELKQQITQLKQKLNDAQQKQQQIQDQNKILQKQLNKFKSQVDVYRSEKLIGEEEQNQSLREEIENLQNDKKELNKTILKLKNQNNNLIMELNKMDEVQEEIQNLKKQKNQIKSKNSNVINQLKSKIETLEQQNKTEELKERLNKLNQEFNNYKKKMEKEKKQLLQQNQNKKQLLLEQQKQHDKDKIKSKQLIKKNNTLINQISILEDQLNNLNQDLQASKKKSNVQNQEKLKEIISNLQSQHKKYSEDSNKNKQIEKYKQQIKQLKNYIESMASSQYRKKDDTDKIQLIEKIAKKKNKSRILKGFIRKLQEELLQKQGIIKTIQRKMKDQALQFQNNNKIMTNLNNNNLKTIKKQYNSRNEELQVQHKREMKEQSLLHQDQIDMLNRHHRDQIDRLKQQGQFNLQNLKEKYQQLQRKLKQEKFAQKKQKSKEFKLNMQELMRLKQQLTIRESSILNMNQQKIGLINQLERKKELELLQNQKISKLSQQIKQMYLKNEYLIQLENKLEASVQFKKQMQEQNARLNNINKNIILDASKLQQTINKFAQSNQALKSKCDQLINSRIIAEKELLVFAQKLSLCQEQSKYLQKRLQENQKEISQLQFKLNTSQHNDNQINIMQTEIYVLENQKKQMIHQLENKRNYIDQLVGKNRQLNRINQKILLQKAGLQQELNRCLAEREDMKLRFVRELQETQRKRKKFQDHLQQCLQKFIISLKNDHNQLVKSNLQLNNKFMSKLGQLSYYLTNKINEYTKIKIGSLKNQNLILINSFQKKLEEQRIYFQGIILKERDIAIRNQEEFKLELQELNQKHDIEKQLLIRSYEQEIKRAVKKQQSTFLHTIQNKLRPQLLITPNIHLTHSKLEENKEFNRSVSIDNVLMNLKKDIQQQKRKLGSPFSKS